MRINSDYIKKALGPGPYTFVEIGVDHGDNASEFIAELPIQQAWLVDPWTADSPAGYTHRTQADWDELHAEVVRRYENYPNVQVLRLTSEAASKVVPDEIDLIYFDGRHDYEGIKSDLLHWFPKVRTGGVLSGDDYFLEVRQAVTDIVARYQFNLRIVPEGTNWWFIKDTSHV